MAAILNPTRVICDLQKIIVDDDGEAIGGSEPYVWPIFFKVDGENDNVTASIKINDSGVSLSLDGIPTVESPKKSHGNLNLSGGQVSAPSRATIKVPKKVGRFKTTLTPIPVTISVDQDSLVAAVIDQGAILLDDIINTISGDSICPPAPDNTSDILGNVITEFVTERVGGLPGLFGGIYLLMEEDFTTDGTAEKGRKALKKVFKKELTDTVIPSISLDSISPDNDVINEIKKKIEDEITMTFLLDGIFWAIVGGAIGGTIGSLAGGGIGIAIGGVAGASAGVIMLVDHDDQLGVSQPMLSHLDVAFGKEAEIELIRAEDESHGKWKFKGRIGAQI